MTFTIGTVYSRVSQLIAQDFGRLAAILVLTYTVPTLIVGMLVALTGDNGTFDILSNVVNFVASSFCLCLMAMSVDAFDKGQPFVLKKALNTASGHLPALFGVSLLTGLIILFGTILLIIPGIIAAIGLCVAAPAYIYENRTGITDSVCRSWKLTQNHRLAIAVIFLPIVAGTLLAISLIMILPDALFTPIISVSIYTLFGSLMTMATQLLSITIYRTLRDTKEGRAPDVTAAVFD